MKKLLFFFYISLFLLPVLHAQSEAEAKAWQEFMTPGEMHKWMARSSGSWSGDVNSYMDPSAPTKWQATATYKMIYNGLYQIGEFKGTMMGMPFEGQSILGYDNAKQQFFNTWIDNFGSGVVLMTGTYDDNANTLFLRGTQTDPLTRKDSSIREEVKFLDDDTQTITMYGVGPNGKEMKMMDIKLTRSAK
jgi:hypothetical protein